VAFSALSMAANSSSINLPVCIPLQLTSMREQRRRTMETSHRPPAPRGKVNSYRKSFQRRPIANDQRWALQSN
jgi:hypothetical protein